MQDLGELSARLICMSHLELHKKRYFLVLVDLLGPPISEHGMAYYGIDRVMENCTFSNQTPSVSAGELEQLLCSGELYRCGFSGDFECTAVHV